MVTGSARYQSRSAQREKEVQECSARDRARNRAYTRLANLHPQEWTVLYEAALKEENVVVSEDDV